MTTSEQEHDMAENEPSPKAEELARVMWPVGSSYLNAAARNRLTQRAIDAGWRPPPEPDAAKHDLHAVIRYGMEAIRLTREYVQPTVNLPAIEGWSWFDWIVWASAALGEDVPAWAAPPDPERSDAEVMADLVTLSDAGQVQIHMTHVDEGLPVYEVSWRKPGWSPPPHGPDIAAAGHSLGWPVARVLEMAQPHINPPPPDPADVVVAGHIRNLTWSESVDAVHRLFTPEALAAAAAKVQEAGS